MLRCVLLVGLLATGAWGLLAERQPLTRTFTNRGGGGFVAHCTNCMPQIRSWVPEFDCTLIGSDWYCQTPPEIERIKVYSLAGMRGYHGYLTYPAARVEFEMPETWVMEKLKESIILRQRMEEEVFWFTIGATRYTQYVSELFDSFLNWTKTDS